MRPTGPQISVGLVLHQGLFPAGTPGNGVPKVYYDSGNGNSPLVIRYTFNCEHAATWA